MANINFNTKECIKALKKLGFVNRSERSKHFKFHPPAGIDKNIKPGKPRFIIVPRHKELRVQHLIIQELLAMGGDELMEKFFENL